MFFERISVAVRSLRFRLMLWNAAAGLLTGAGILFAVHQGVRYTFISDLDQVLKEDLQEINLHFTDNQGNDWATLRQEMDRKARGHDFHGWFVQFLDDAGKPVWKSVRSPALPPLTNQQRTHRSFDIGDYRLAYRRLPRPMHTAVSVIVGCNKAYIDRNMATIDRLILLVGGAVLITVPLLGYLLAGYTGRILSNLIQRTEGLRPTELKERLPVRGTGDELDQLARTINGLLDRLGAYLQQERDFLANAAHELRTPLAAIRSSVEVALEGDRSQEDYRELLGEIIEQCSALQAIVNQLLFLAESDANRGQIHAVQVPLHELVGRALEMFNAVAEHHGIRLTADELTPVWVRGNAHHLRQVLNNLFDNAIKFTAQRYPWPIADKDDPELGEGRIEVRLAADRNGQSARLEIEDNGIGIPAADLPHIFDRFFRVDRLRGREHGAGGTGLGLSICHAIVTAHRGQLRVRSEPGVGTTVEVVLPLASPAEQLTPAPTRSA